MHKKGIGSKRFVPEDNRFVAFLDILGFKQKIAREPYNKIYNELDYIHSLKVKIGEKEFENNPFLGSDLKTLEDTIYVVTFSDSIIIFSRKDTINDFKRFLYVVNHYFINSIKNNIPMKGGIAHGKITLVKSRQIYFGQPIIDAYEIENIVNYMGVVCHNSIDRYIYNKGIKETYLLKNVKTILKCGNITHLNLNWFNNNNLKIKEIILNFHKTVSGSPRKYIDNTIEMLKIIKQK